MSVSLSGVFGTPVEIDGSTNLVDTWYVLGTVAAGKVAVLNILAVNRAATTAKVRLAVEVGGATGTPDDAEHIVYDVPIAPGAPPLESYPRTLYAGDSVLVRSDTADVNFIAFAAVGAA